MTIVVGFDSTPAAEAALFAAAELANEAGEPVHLVYVVSQAELDGTGELQMEDKRRAIYERLFREQWGRIRKLMADHPELETADLDLQIRFAPVHLTQLPRRIARELIQVAVDYGGDRILLGNEGPPGSIVEMLLESGQLERAPSVVGVLLCARGDRIDLPSTDGWAQGSG
jgi:nucleotide-binding universal stress UspA family protein